MPKRRPMRACKAAAARALVTAKRTKRESVKPPLSPYEARVKLLGSICGKLKRKTKLHHSRFTVEDPITVLFDQEERENWSKQRMKEEEKKLSQADVDENFHCFIINEKCLEMYQKNQTDIVYADPRNQRGSSFLMLNTASSYYMYPVLTRQLKAAQRLLNKALKTVKNAAESKSGADAPASATAGVATRAYSATVAAVLAANVQDHWRLDCDMPEECDKITKLASRALQTLFLFSDAELGIHKEDVFTRAGLLKYCESLDWNEGGFMSAELTFKTKANGQGRGRQYAPPPPPPKMPKAVAAPPPSAVMATYLHALHANGKLENRSRRTFVQLRLASRQDPTKFVRFVVSGRANMKKVGQVCAYLTGASPSFDYRARVGKSVVGSRFTLTKDGSKLWIASKATGKKAAGSGAEFVEDKTIFITQVFQGLCIGSWDRSVFRYDSLDAKYMNQTPGAVLFQLPAATGAVASSASVGAAASTPCTEYLLTAEGIIPFGCTQTHDLTLPRVVTSEPFDEHMTTSFGQNVHHVNDVVFRGDRTKGPKFITFGAMTPQLQWGLLISTYRKLCTPLCNPDGRDPLKVVAYQRSYWCKTENWEKSAPPDTRMIQKGASFSCEVGF